MKNRAPVVIAAIAAVLLIGFVAYRVMRPRPTVTPPAATATAAAPPQEDADEAARRNAPRIEPEALMNAMKTGNVTVVDVRDRSAFEQQHIAGSRNIPLAQIESAVPYLPKSRPIVTVCT